VPASTRFLAGGLVPGCAGVAPAAEHVRCMASSKSQPSGPGRPSLTPRVEHCCCLVLPTACSASAADPGAVA
jgi:hypothetical protein